MLEFDEKFLENYAKLDYRRKVRLRIKFFFKFLVDENENKEDIFDIKQTTFEKYFRLVNTLEANKETKFRYVSNLKEYLDWIRKNRNISTKECNLDITDVFSKIKFNDTGSFRAETPFLKIHVYDCLRYFREQNFEDYILWGLIAFTSMRIGGAMNLKISDINLEERYLITDEKETDNLGRNNVYFIPKQFKNSLESYILEIQERNPTQDHLFVLKDKSYRLHLKKWGNSFNKRSNENLDPHPHLFRDIFNTEMKILGACEEDRCLILNQMPNSVNKRRYLKRLKQINNRKLIYDQYFPYYDFFKPNR